MNENKENRRIKLLNLLGLCQKAGYLVSGYDSVIAEMRKGRLKIVFVASDSSSKTIDNFKKKCFFYHIPVNFEYSGDELSASIGRNRRIIALNNDKMYAAIKKLVEVNE